MTLEEIKKQLHDLQEAVNRFVRENEEKTAAYWNDKRERVEALVQRENTGQAPFTPYGIAQFTDEVMKIFRE